MLDKAQFRQHLENAKNRLVRLEADLERMDTERETLVNNIDELRRDIRSLAQLAGESEDIALGLTDACKEIFRRTDLALTPTEIKDRLEELGFPIEEHKHALASISTTLRRLALNRFIVGVDGPSGRRWKRFRKPTPQAVARISRTDANSGVKKT